MPEARLQRTREAYRTWVVCQRCGRTVEGNPEAITLFACWDCPPREARDPEDEPGYGVGV